MASFRLENLTLGYDGHPAVHHLNGEFATGSLTAVLGPNGAGKSTLLKALAGLLKPIAGTISRKKDDAKEIAYLPQASEVDRTFPVSVKDLVATGLFQRRGLFTAQTKQDESAIAQALNDVGLDGFAARGLDTLSGGQFQRTLFARVILQDAKTILLDEPFSAVDSKTTDDLLKIIAHWQSERRTIVAVLHDEELVRRHFPDTLLLAREPLGWGATAQVLTKSNLLRARQIHEAWDEAAEDCERDEHDHHH
ncbi:MAG TPA: zinc ABC transporter ATP-binding protein AztA [Aestuariivirga sp.]